MRSSRLVIDRLFRLFTPSLDSTFVPGLIPVGEGIWSVDRRLRLFGAFAPCRSVVARVANDDLVVIGAPALVSKCAHELKSLGRVVAVVAPNSFHYLYAAEALAEFSSARFVVAPGLAERIPMLPPALALDHLAEPPWSSGLEYVVFGPVRGVSEVIFYHAPSRTVVITDLAANLIHLDRRSDRWIWRAYGMPAEFGPSRNARTLLRIDRHVSRQTLRRVLEWPFERMIVAHGEAIEKDARKRFADAFAKFL